MPWSKVCAFSTRFPADSVECCPFSDFADFLLCGTYHLLEDTQENAPQERIGIIYLMKFATDCLETVQEIETDGVLDLKWCLERVAGDIVVAAATAKGHVRVYQFSDRLLVPLDYLDMKPDQLQGDFMVLAVNWFSVNATEAKICLTDNKGHASVVLLAGGKLSLLETWKAHDLEAWTVDFDVDSSDILYTGGDDAKLKIWDKRTAAPKVLKKQDTGVTIITTNTGDPWKILSGSFDEILNIWDKRRMKDPMGSVKTSGGVWRAKCRGNRVLTANIYGGFQIIDLTLTPQIVGQFHGPHTSLAYGADWGKTDENVSYVATCSFYDKTLCISTWDFT